MAGVQSITDDPGNMMGSNHDICQIKASQLYMRSDELSEGALTEMDMKVCRRVDRKEHGDDSAIM